jgi:hypothetical protein
VKSKEKADGVLSDKDASVDDFTRAEARLRRAVARIKTHELHQG